MLDSSSSRGSELFLYATLTGAFPGDSADGSSVGERLADNAAPRDTRSVAVQPEHAHTTASFQHESHARVQPRLEGYCTTALSHDARGESETQHRSFIARTKPRALEREAVPDVLENAARGCVAFLFRDHPKLF